MTHMAWIFPWLTRAAFVATVWLACVMVTVHAHQAMQGRSIRVSERLAVLTKLGRVEERLARREMHHAKPVF